MLFKPFLTLSVIFNFYFRNMFYEPLLTEIAGIISVLSDTYLSSRSESENIDESDSVEYDVSEDRNTESSLPVPIWFSLLASAKAIEWTFE